MFDFVRNHTRLALGFMLLLIIPSFIFFGVQGYSSFSDASNAAVASVDGQPITRTEWDGAHKRALDQIRRQAPTIDTTLYDTRERRLETLDGLVRERLLLAAANELHLFPSVARMQRLFDSDPQFAGLRGPDGKISRELLAAQGLTPEGFDQRLRQDFGVRQVLAGIAQTVPVPAAAASAALDAFMQRREVQVQRFEPAAYRAQVAPTDADIDAYYKANPARFQAPEQATIDYVVLDLDTLGRQASVTDADLRKAYADAAARYTAREERRASHILITAEKGKPAAERAKAKARAEALLAEVRKSPGSFADVARKNSQDPGSAERGGDLDFFGRGEMAKPFEDAVFALKAGEISDVVETEFGFHIINLQAARGGQAKPFEDVRSEVEAELRKALAQRRWADAAEQFTNTVYEQSDSLQPVITKLGLQKKTATVQRTPAPGSSGPLASSKFLDAVFSVDAIRNKRNTDATEVGANQIVAAHVVQHMPARTLPLADVKERVREQLVSTQSAALARKEGLERLAALRGGPSAANAAAASAAGGAASALGAAAAAAPTAALPDVQTISRVQPQGLPRPLLDAALRADAATLPAVVGVDLAEQGYAVLRVLRVLPREPAPGGEEPMRAQYAQAWAAAEADAYLAALRQRFKAEIKPEASAATDAASAPVR